MIVKFNKYKKGATKNLSHLFTHNSVGLHTEND
jgi:hypothetical protein